MARLRTILFWMHLVTGVVAGAVILLMSVTGVALTFEKQVLEWADQRQSSSVPPSAEARALLPETLLVAVSAAQPGAAPTGITFRANPRAPVTVTLEGNRALLVDPYRGVVLGAPSPGLRRFFRTMTDWHRWLALDGASRAMGRLVTGAANLGFLFIVVSGLYLWFPRAWTRRQFAQVVWFRGRLRGKARDFNWHNVIGVWSAVPLALVVAGAVPISFPWASNLVYRMAGEAPPPPAQAARPSRPADARQPGGPGRSDGHDGQRPMPPGEAAVDGLDAAWARAVAHVPAWRAIALRLGGPSDPSFTFTIDTGYGGQPQKRGTLTIDRASGAVRKWETFGDLGPGRRLRSWLRFVHTGEYYGLAGQTVAGLVSAGAAVLVYTGLALACRRWWGWMRRRDPARAEAKAA